VSDIGATGATASEIDAMSATCDTLFCGRPATQRITGRTYCDRHADGIAAAVDRKAGRRIVRPVRLVAATLG
jgi:hypothetical protein